MLFLGSFGPSTTKQFKWWHQRAGMKKFKYINDLWCCVGAMKIVQIVICRIHVSSKIWLIKFTIRQMTFFTEFTIRQKIFACQKLNIHWMTFLMRIYYSYQSFQPIQGLFISNLTLLNLTQSSRPNPVVLWLNRQWIDKSRIQ